MDTLDRHAMSLSQGDRQVEIEQSSGHRVSILLVMFASFCGLAALIYPLVVPLLPVDEGVEISRSLAAPLVFTVVAMLSLSIVVAELAGSGSAGTNTAKVAALLGALVAIDACLRLVPSLGGASPIFMLIIVAGAVFGARMGFLVGSLTLLLSAFLTGGIGPWLPYQMLGAGWIGLGAGLLPRRAGALVALPMLVVYGVVSAILYGFMINLYSWPFAAPDVDQAAGLFWSPGLSWHETIERYARFYLVTSLSHDLFRAAGNAVLLPLLGGPIIRTLDRARRRFSWQPAVLASTSRSDDEDSREIEPLPVA